MSENEKLEERIGEVEDFKMLVSAITDDLDTAETVEKITDFITNIQEAIKNTNKLKNEMEAMLTKLVLSLR